MLQILSSVITVYSYALLAWVILSWIRAPWSVSIREQTAFFFEPLLKPIRALLSSFGTPPGIDLSPLFLYLILAVVRQMLFRTLG